MALLHAIPAWGGGWISAYSGRPGLWCKGNRGGITPSFCSLVPAAQPPGGATSMGPGTGGFPSSLAPLCTSPVAACALEKLTAAVKGDFAGARHRQPQREVVIPAPCSGTFPWGINPAPCLCTYVDLRPVQTSPGAVQSAAWAAEPQVPSVPNVGAGKTPLFHL